MLIFICLLAFYLAFNLGANDVANSMGTSVGSKAISLRQALVIAGILEFSGAVFFGQEVTATLGTKLINPALFTSRPEILLLGMVSVLLACGLWLNIATLFGLPISSSHAVVGAIAGFGYLAIGPTAIDWPSLGKITLTWIVTPVFSGAIAALFYGLIRHYILNQSQPLLRLREWIPWLSAALLSIFGVIVLPTLSQPIQTWIEASLHLSLPAHDLPLAIGILGCLSLSFYTWYSLERSTIPQPQLRLEALFARFQLVSACFVAFAHGSNDVGNVIAPLAVIVHIQQQTTVPTLGLQVPLWLLALGGMGIVVGLAVLGRRVIATIGESIITLEPSSGFCAELATATTILLASHYGLPVSTSHALVGGVVGIGLSRNWRSLPVSMLRSIGLAWVITLPLAAGLGAGIFALGCRLLAY